jgi:hypothetical protein
MYLFDYRNVENELSLEYKYKQDEVVAVAEVVVIFGK